MGLRRAVEREALVEDGRELARRDRGERPLLQLPQPPGDVRAEPGARGDAAREQILRGELGRRPRGPAEQDDPAAWLQQLERRPPGLPADAVEHERHALHGGVPVRSQVVQPGRAERPDARDLLLAARRAEHRRAGAQRALDEQGAETARGAGDEHDVVLGDLGDVEDPERRAAGADHGDARGGAHPVGQHVQARRVGDDALGVAAARLAEVRDDAPADPGVVDVLADRGDDARDLAARDRREVGQRERAHRGPAADRGVEEVDAGGGDVDEHLPRAGRRIVDLLPAQVVGRAELVQSDRVHGGDRRTSSTLEVKEVAWRAGTRHAGRRDASPRHAAPRARPSRRAPRRASSRLTHGPAPWRASRAPMSRPNDLRRSAPMLVLTSVLTPSARHARCAAQTG